MALVVAWPALWDFSHSPRLTDAALLLANRSLDEPVITGPGLYRRDPVAAAPGGSR
jgi:NTE family protein